jgi:hypothetical protein
MPYANAASRECNEGSTLHCEHDGHCSQQGDWARQGDIGIHGLHEGKPQQWVSGVKNNVLETPPFNLIAKPDSRESEERVPHNNDKGHNCSGYGHLPGGQISINHQRVSGPQYQDPICEVDHVHINFAVEVAMKEEADNQDAKPKKLKFRDSKFRYSSSMKR